MSEKLIELLKRTFNLWVEKLWLIEIDKAIDRHKKAVNKANRMYHVMHKLVEKYNEIYNENLWEKRHGN